MIQDDTSDCGERLILYDSDWADPQRIVKAFYSHFSEAQENVDFVTRGQSLYISFLSPSGSYSGSSISYWAIYDFHDASLDGQRIK